VRMTLDGKTPQKEKDVLRRLTASPLVRSVYRVSGEDCFVVDVVCRRIEDVNALLLDLQSTRALQSSRTAFVLETVLEKGTLGPLPSALVAEEPDAHAREKT
jgi:DNA-binding Lrp family transcriptional regulator